MPVYNIVFTWFKRFTLKFNINGNSYLKLWPIIIICISKIFIVYYQKFVLFNILFKFVRFYSFIDLSIKIYHMQNSERYIFVNNIESNSICK